MFNNNSDSKAFETIDSFIYIQKKEKKKETKQ